tara:strand:+ start:6120 stop:8408 length:2289 start_codon:yes stop_codon:yes gene_type:complete
MTVKQNSICQLLLSGLVLLLSNDLLAQSAQNNAGGIQEIVVTAQRREQEIQSVGITMSAFTREDIESFQLNTLSEITNQVANVQLFEDYGSGLPTWVIRGVGLQDFNANNTPTAAIYLDDVYQTSSAMGEVALFDIARVEVLKGPQGGLYGRNTSGGAINVVSALPEFQNRNAYVDISYGSWQRLQLEAASNFTLTDDLALRLALRRQSSNDGWQNNLLTGQSHGELDQTDIRATLLFDPDTDFSARLKFSAGSNDSEIALGRSVAAYSSAGGLCTAIVQGYRDDANCFDWASVTRLAFAGTALPVAAQADNGESVLSEPLNRNDHNYHSISAELDYEFADFSLTSISAFDRFDYGVELDLDASFGEYGHRPSSSDIEIWSQEFRLASNTEQDLQWLGGLVISNDYFLEERNFLLRDNLLIGLEQGDLNYRQTTQSRALYGQLDYQFNDEFSVNFDLRYTNESKKYRNGTFFVPAFSLYFVQDVSSDYELDSNWSGKLQLNWQYQENILFYGSVSSGFKSGGFYGGFPFQEEEVLPYAEETILAYEVGMKSGLIDDRLLLNIAGFYYDYRDVQGFISEVNPATLTVIDRLANQGDAEHKGVELELDWRVNEQLYFSLALGYLDAEITDSNQMTTNTVGATVPLTGKRAYAPRWNSSFAIVQEAGLTQDLRYQAALEHHYRSEFSGHMSSLADQAIYELPAYGVSNLYFSVYPNEENWELSLWIKNLADKSYRTRTKSDGLMSYMDVFGEPRSFGVSASFRWQ